MAGSTMNTWCNVDFILNVTLHCLKVGNTFETLDFFKNLCTNRVLLFLVLQYWYTSQTCLNCFILWIYIYLSNFSFHLNYCIIACRLITFFFVLFFIPCNWRKQRNKKINTSLLHLQLHSFIIGFFMAFCKYLEMKCSDAFVFAVIYHSYLCCYVIDLYLYSFMLLVLVLHFWPTIVFYLLIFSHMHHLITFQAALFCH